MSETCRAFLNLFIVEEVVATTGQGEQKTTDIKRDGKEKRLDHNVPSQESIFFLHFSFPFPTRKSWWVFSSSAFFVILW